MANTKIPSELIADSSITAAKLADGTITTADIADSNVTTAKIADSGVTTAKIGDAQVTTAKITDANVTTGKIADDAVTTAKMASNSVTSDTIASGITLAGTTTLSSHLVMGDNDTIKLGDGADLQIHHDSGHSHIINTTGDLTIDSQGDDIILKAADDFLVVVQGTDIAIQAVGDGKVGLRYNNFERLATTNTGIDVTGTATMDGLTVDSGAANQVATFSSTDAGAFLYIQDNNALGYYHGSSSGSYVIRDTDNKNRINIANGGDISFYEDTGTTAKLFWDASAERLGIGTTSPTELLHVHQASTSVARMRLSNTDGYLEIGTNNQVMNLDSQTHTFRNEAGSTEYARIDTSGNLLVGTTNTAPATNNVEGIVLRNEGHINVSRAGGVVGYFNRKTDDGTILSFNKDGTGIGSIGSVSGDVYIGSGDTGIRFHDGTDSIFPVTAATGADRGSTVNLGHSTNAFNDLYLSGGTIVAGRTTFGSAGFWDASGTGNNKGLRVGGAGLYPTNGTGTALDATIDIGTASARFKDLYLSGGAYLGGTGAANKLDDYEEGTWTPTGVGLTLSSPSGTYTKVGRLVTVTWQFVYPTTSSGSQTSIAGLPFTVGTGYNNGGNHGYVNGSAAVSIAHITAVTTSLLYRTANGGVALTHADLSGATIRGSMTYMTA